MAESNNFDFSNIANMLNNIDIGQLSSLLGSFNPGSSEDDKRSRSSGRGGEKAIELLNALKPVVNSDRAEIIDMVIQMYVISKILKW